MTKEKEIKTEKRFKDEKEKHLLMWAGVIFFMILIVSIWVFNIKNVFLEINSKSEETGLDTEEIKDKFNESVEQMKLRLEEVNKISEEFEKIQENDASSTNEQAEKVNNLEKEIEKLKNDLEIIASSSINIQNTTTTLVTSTKEKIN